MYNYVALNDNWTRNDHCKDYFNEADGENVI